MVDGGVAVPVRGHDKPGAGAVPQARTVFPDWPTLTENVVHALPLNAALFPNDPEIQALVADLRQRSPRFRALRADQTVRGLTRIFKEVHHPDVGRIELTYRTFDVRDAPRPAPARRHTRAGKQQRRGPRPPGRPAGDARTGS
ncbi:MmyB family transcriptional regulator [Micromonospora chersina]|uniref:MmyB family transcriptional regulator n=1 Tax=Micromonospora chersina TaxID=47854 RepID=UPI003402B802